MNNAKDQTSSIKGRSRVSTAVLSLIVPGLGQIMRGRIFAGLLFFLNVVLYGLTIFAADSMHYDVKTPSLLIALGVWVFSALDAFLRESSFIILALLVALFFFGSGFFGAYFILPHLDV